jgi:hypothetical protein
MDCEDSEGLGIPGIRGGFKASADSGLQEIQGSQGILGVQGIRDMQ